MESPNEDSKLPSEKETQERTLEKPTLKEQMTSISNDMTICEKEYLQNSGNIYKNFTTDIAAFETDFNNLVQNKNMSLNKLWSTLTRGRLIVKLELFSTFSTS